MSAAGLDDKLPRGFGTALDLATPRFRAPESRFRRADFPRGTLRISFRKSEQGRNDSIGSERAGGACAARNAASAKNCNGIGKAQMSLCALQAVKNDRGYRDAPFFITVNRYRPLAHPRNGFATVRKL